MNAASYHNRGYAKVKLGKYEDAIEDYDQSIKLDPKNLAIYHNRGVFKSEIWGI